MFPDDIPVLAKRPPGTPVPRHGARALATGPGLPPARRRVAVIAGFWLASLWFAATSAFACRYNVRDVGFVDLGTEPYHLFCFVPPPTSPELEAALRSAAEASLRDVNVLFELVDPIRQPTHPALAHRSSASRAPDSPPDVSAVLVSPDGPSLPLHWPRTGTPSRSVAEDFFQGIAISPTRAALVAAAHASFGVVLLVEGTDAGANRLARQTIAESFVEIGKHMKSLPKAIEAPPSVVVLESSAAERERILLWALRQSTDPSPEPRAFVVYGRARWIGPAIRMAELTTRNLVGLFSIIGADCECGMDLAWTQGTRLPVRWPESLHPVLAKSLGFDPENPLVKTEIGSILGRRGSRPKASSLGTPVASAPGIQPSAGPEVSSAVTPSNNPSTPTPPRPAPTEAGRRDLVFLGLGVLLAGAIVASGVFIALRGRS